MRRRALLVGSLLFASGVRAQGATLRVIHAQDAASIERAFEGLAAPPIDALIVSASLPAIASSSPGSPPGIACRCYMEPVAIWIAAG